MQLRAFVVALLVAAGCYNDPAANICADSNGCDRQPGGVCWPSPAGYSSCAYPDSTCPEGYRWDDLHQLSNACVHSSDLPGDAALADAALADAPTVIDGGPDGGPSVCSERIAFVTDRNGISTDDIYTMPPTGSPQLPLTNHGAIDTAPVWSPTGDALAFISERSGGGDKEVWVTNADGTNPVNVSNDGDLTTEDRSPAWSPDGTRLAFVSKRNGREQVFVVNRDGTEPHPLTSPDYVATDPAWSPDGTRLAYRSNQGGSWFTIHVMNADGSAQRPITSSGVVRSGPQWSPDGTRVLYEGGDFGTSNVLTVLVDGSGVDADLRNLSNHRASGERNSMQRWSPDGRRVVFVSTRDGNEEIYIVGADGGVPQRVTEDPAIDTTPAWSPDSSSIVFMSRRTGDNEVWVVTVGGLPLNLSQNPSKRDDAPAWLACPRR